MRHSATSWRTLALIALAGVAPVTAVVPVAPGILNTHRACLVGHLQRGRRSRLAGGIEVGSSPGDVVALVLLAARQEREGIMPLPTRFGKKKESCCMVLTWQGPRKS